MVPNGEQDSVVLVMDRADGDGRLISSTLEKAGFHVYTSSDVINVLNLCHTFDRSIQLVIVDIATPGIQIPELLQNLQDLNPAIRVLLLVDQKASETLERRPIASNVRGSLARPFRRAQLLGSVLEATREPLVRTA